MALICDNCGEVIDRTQHMLAQGFTVGNQGVDLHTVDNHPEGRDCQAEFLAAIRKLTHPNTSREVTP